MISNFYSDLAFGKGAEQIALDVLSSSFDNYSFYDISNDKTYYHTGDLLVINNQNGARRTIEVKNDTRIGETNNVLCEYAVWYEDQQQFKEGDMARNGDIYCVVDQQSRRIHLIDFPLLRQHFTEGKHKIIKHPQQTTYCYLCPLSLIEQWGALIVTIDY